MKLDELVWPDFSGLRAPTLILPLGATEQHGPHLPIGTDTTIVTSLAHAVAEGRSDRVVAPTLPYGSSGEHATFPGTLSLGQAALELAVVELLRSADHFAGVAIVCWHGGNAEALDRASRRLLAEGRRARVWLGRHTGGDLHAGYTETSLMLHLAAELVRPQRQIGADGTFSSMEAALRTEGVRAASPNGVLGDPRLASAEEGAAIFAGLAEDLDRFLTDGP